MHLENGKVPADYYRYTGRKTLVNLLGLVLLIVLFLVSISVGSVSIPLRDVLRTLFTGEGSRQLQMIIFNIRLPQALTAIVAGAGLSVCGAAMQSILRNPLGSPFTLGISNAAAFGAAFSVMILGAGTMHSTGTGVISQTRPYLTTASAFVFCMIAAGIILAVAKIRRASPEVMVLTGVALGSLFTAGTMFLQYFADDVQLAATVFWTFGDLARSSWRELLIMSTATAAAAIYFSINNWNYNAIDAGDETAGSLGVPVERKRLFGMFVSSLVTATIISFVGVIGFVGLVGPHIVRRLLGDDHRYLIPGSLLAGALLLLSADIAARMLLAPSVLPVSILTSFVGAPLFVFLLIRGYRR